MNPSRLQELFRKYFDKTATQPERDELSVLINQEENREQVMQAFRDSWESYDGDENVTDGESMLERILGKSEAPVRKLKVWRSIAAAAAIFVFLAGGYFLFFHKKSEAPIVHLNEDVNPGSYKARLTLADGSTIILDSAKMGELARQGNTQIINKDGQLVYSGTGGEVLYNTVSTAKGETYSMTLADGSQIWLNSASSIHFPVVFTGDERRIEVTGEVYVKVAHDKVHPFIASANGMEVLALGTEFNINAYPDEAAMNATLIEGSVKVSKGGSVIMLQPGQQTKVGPNGGLSQAGAANLHEVTGWKDGLFYFDNAGLKTILRQFARWYDVEVVYEGPVKERKFLVIVNRGSTLKSVLEMLQDNDIVYRIEGKKLIVKSG